MLREATKIMLQTKLVFLQIKLPSGEENLSMINYNSALSIIS